MQFAILVDIPDSWPNEGEPVVNVLSVLLANDLVIALMPVAPIATYGVYPRPGELPGEALASVLLNAQGDIVEHRAGRKLAARLLAEAQADVDEAS